jgi:uncharacterized protein (TIGR00251 family)
MKDWCRSTSSGAGITVQVTPHAKRTEITGVPNEVLKIRLQARPIDGKANEALIRCLADVLGMPKSAFVITRGFTHRIKTVEISAPGLMAETVRRILLGHRA